MTEESLVKWCNVSMKLISDVYIDQVNKFSDDELKQIKEIELTQSQLSVIERFGVCFAIYRNDYLTKLYSCGGMPFKVKIIE